MTKIRKEHEGYCYNDSMTTQGCTACEVYHCCYNQNPEKASKKQIVSTEIELKITKTLADGSTLVENCKIFTRPIQEGLVAIDYTSPSIGKTVSTFTSNEEAQAQILKIARTIQTSVNEVIEEETC